MARPLIERLPFGPGPEDKPWIEGNPTVPTCSISPSDTTSDQWAAVIIHAGGVYDTAVTVCETEAQARDAVRNYLTMCWRARGLTGELPEGLRDALAALDYTPVEGYAVTRCRSGARWIDDAHTTSLV